MIPIPTPPLLRRAAGAAILLVMASPWLASDAFAFLSRASIGQELRDQPLAVIPVAGLQIARDFRFALRRGEPLPLNSLMMKSIGAQLKPAKRKSA